MSSVTWRSNLCGDHHALWHGEEQLRELETVHMGTKNSQIFKDFRSFKFTTNCGDCEPYISICFCLISTLLPLASPRSRHHVSSRCLGHLYLENFNQNVVILSFAICLDLFNLWSFVGRWQEPIWRYFILVKVKGNFMLCRSEYRIRPLLIIIPYILQYSVWINDYQWYCCNSYDVGKGNGVGRMKRFLKKIYSWKLKGLHLLEGWF